MPVGAVGCLHFSFPDDPGDSVTKAKFGCSSRQNTPKTSNYDVSEAPLLRSAYGVRSTIAIDGACPALPGSPPTKAHGNPSKHEKRECGDAALPCVKRQLIEARTVGKRFNHHILKFKDAFDHTEPPDYAFPWQRRKASALRKRRDVARREEKPK